MDRSGRGGARAGGTLAVLLAVAATGAAGQSRPPCAGGAVPVATVPVVSGAVTLNPSGGSTIPVARGMRLCPGDLVTTGDGARAEIRFAGRDTTLGLNANTTLSIPPPEEGEAAPDAFLGSGLLRFISSVRGLFDIGTRHVNAGIDGTEALIAAPEGAGGTLVLVGEGTVTLSGEGGSLDVPAGAAGFAGARRAPERAEAAEVPPPFRALLADPAGASDWAIYYPPILLARGAFDPAVAGALERLAADDPDGAEALLATVPPDAPGAADALALRAVVAVLRNRTGDARAFAEGAVAAGPDRAPPRIALSYVLQAEGRIDEAARAAEDAVAREPDDAYAWARLAELRLVRTDRRGAVRAAERSLEGAETALARAVLGFAALSADRYTEAEIAFAKAVAAAPDAPLPRLGTGLLRIRQGRIEEGRRELELAASLDPRRASLRTWLGRAHLAEGRPENARGQFALAQERDPDSPTPWLFSAAERFAANDPIAALADIEAARARGPGRSVIRSEEGLGEDRAVRGAAIGRVLETLGFVETARTEAALAAEEDPANGTAHRVQADVFATDPELAFAQTSAELRSQLLGPPSLAPIEAARGEADLALLEQAGPSRASFTDYSPFFEQQGVAARLSGFGGTQETLGDTVSFTAAAEGVSVGVGQFHYRTDGYRANNDVTHDVVSVQAKGRVTPEFTLFGEYRYRRTDAGDRSLEFDLSDASRGLRQRDERNRVRLGAHHRLAPGQDLLGALTWAEQQRKLSDAQPFSVTEARGEADGWDVQGQHIGRFGPLTTVSGFAYTRTNLQTASSFADPTLPFLAPFTSVEARTPEIVNGYAYATWRVTDTGFLTAAEATAGVSLDYVTFDFAGEDDEARTNPKAGIRLDFGPAVTLRGAYTQTVTPSLVFEQRLEPTTVAGFVQYRPEVTGARVRQGAAAIEVRPLSLVTVGAEGAWRNVDAPVLGSVDEESREYEAGAHVTAALSPRVAGSLRASWRDVDSDLAADPDLYRVTRLGADLRYFDPSGFFAGIGLEQVWGEFEDDLDSGDDAFVLGEFRVGYRLPEQRGIVSLDVSNAFDSDFGFEERPLRAIGAGAVSDPLFARDFTAFARVTLAF